MTKFLNKLFLCGILLSSVNYELAYSIKVGTKEEEGVAHSSRPGQFNITVDFEKNEASTDNNELNTNMDIQYSNTIGKYDEDKYTIDNYILKADTLSLFKYDTKPGDNTRKWYKTDENGNLPENPAEYKKLNKAIFTITSDGELTLSESEGGGEKTSYLVVTHFGKLVNNGKLIANSNTSILTPNIILGSEQRTRGMMMELPYYFQAILNLNDIAIENSNGTIVLKDGSTIDSINMIGIIEKNTIRCGTVAGIYAPLFFA